MLERIWKRIIGYRRWSPWSIVALSLWPAAIAFKVGSAIDRARRSRKKVTLPVPVISVGNITLGGTGKTPLVEVVARYLGAEGLRVGIVSSGYGRSSRETITAAGYRLREMDVSVTGDEVMLLARALPQAVFSIDRVKAVAAAVLAEAGNVDVIIIDDGFQHFQLHRDLDIVAYDATVRERHLRLFPRGFLREPLSGLGRADIIIITRAKFARRLEQLKKKLTSFSPKASCYSAGFSISELVGRHRSYPAKYLEDKAVFLFAGVGNFRTLRKQVSALCPNLDHALELSDHQVYTPALLKRIKAMAARHGSDVIVTTAKDWVKIGDFDFGREFYYLAQTTDLDPGEEKLVEEIKSRLKLHGRVSGGQKI